MPEFSCNVDSMHKLLPWKINLGALDLGNRIVLTSMRESALLVNGTGDMSTMKLVSIGI